MRNSLLKTSLALVLLAVAPGLPATAADRCRVVPHTIDEIQNAVHAGSGLLETLEQTEATVAIVGRIGSDQSKRGIRYTHAGLAWRDHPVGRWHFIHMLNHCGRDSSQLFDDGPADFFLERPFRYDAKIVIPVPELQNAIVDRLREHADTALHEPRYNAIANPFETRYQNSNQWLLELVAVALAPEVEATRVEAQSILKAMDFEPDRVRLGFFERIGTHRMGNVTMRDHSRSELRDGGFMYVSVRALARFLEDNGLAQETFELQCPACS